MRDEEVDGPWRLCDLLTQGRPQVGRRLRPMRHRVSARPLEVLELDRAAAIPQRLGDGLLQIRPPRPACPRTVYAGDDDRGRAAASRIELPPPLRLRRTSELGDTIDDQAGMHLRLADYQVSAARQTLSAEKNSAKVKSKRGAT